MAGMAALAITGFPTESNALHQVALSEVRWDMLPANLAATIVSSMYRESQSSGRYAYDYCNRYMRPLRRGAL